MKILRTVTAFLAITLLAAACGSSSARTIADSEVACDKVSAELKDAETALKVATAEAKDTKGTPNESQAKAKVAEAQSQVNALNTRQGECDDAKVKDAPPSDGETNVEDSDGELRSLPLVDDNGNVIYGDTTSDPRTPASYADEKANGPVESWQDVVDRLGKLDWYVEALNARKSKTGFDWEDVKKWATVTDVDPRVIQVYNLELTDQEARDAVRELIGNDVDTLPVARHDCIVNTRGFGHERVRDFVDCRKMVRVAVAPIVFNEKGEPVGLRYNTGIFVDCFNIWWIPRLVTATPQPPTSTTRPPGTTSTTVPGTTTSTTVDCPSGKCTPPTTVASSPTTTPTPTTAPPDNGGQGDSGDGATNDTSPPTTEAPAPSPPTTSSPTTNPPPPPG